MSLHHRTLRILSNGHLHSGEDLSRQLGVSRTAVWKAIRVLRAMGVTIHAVAGKGYHLARPVELLDEQAIRQALPQGAAPLLSELEIHHSLRSTNSHLLDAARAGRPGGHACLAEHQQQGRGRRGRHWASPLGANIYLSLLWRFELEPPALSGMSLAAGVAVAKSLAQMGITDIGLKWPNDVLWQGRKLAGVLLETSGESHGAQAVVIGVGLNVHMPRHVEIDQAWTDVQSATPSPPGRNALAGALLGELLLSAERYGQQGLQACLPTWRELDALAGRTVRLQGLREKVTGVARGVDDHGALLIERDRRITAYQSGDVSARLYPGET